MLNIQRFQCNMLGENCYVINDETQECVIIDCGAFFEEERKAIIEYITSNSLYPKHLLVTHGHVDHNFGNDTIFRHFGLQPEISEADGDALLHLKEQASAMFGIDIDNNYPPVGHYFEPNEKPSFGNHQLNIIATAGHTPGGVCFYSEDERVLFSGDTIFKGSIGRTDFLGGNRFMMIQSLRHLAQLPDDTKVLSGHGESTTIGYELATNPYMDR